MEESNLKVEIPPTIIDLDSPDGQDSSSPNNPTDQFDNQGRSPVPPTIDLDPTGHRDSSDLQKDELNSPELQKSALRDENDNNTSRDSSDRRNIRAERKGDTDRVHSRSSDAWATPMDRVHRSSESPISRSISPRGNRPHRNRSRSRSASWSRSRSRSPSGPRRVDWRSPVGGNDRRAPVWGNDRRPPVNAQPCRDFVAGRCRWGQKCRFLHEDGTGTGHDRYDYSRERDTSRGGGRDRDRDNRDREREMYRERERGERERYPSKEDEIYDMRGQREYSRERQVSQGHRSNYDEPPSYEYNNRSSEKCFDFSRGRCKRGADCRFIHDETSSHNNTTVAWGMRERDDRETERDERGGRERDRDERERVGGGGTNYDERERDLSFDGRRGGRKEEICKFFLEGRCGRGQSCRFLHEVAHQVRGENNQNSTNESSWSSQRDNTGSQNQYMVPVPPVNPYLAVPTNLLPPPPPGNPPVRPPPVNLPPPPVNVPVPPPPVIQPNPSNLLTSEQAANITDVSAFLSQIMGRNNSTVPVPVPVPKPDSPVPVLHESPTTPPVETEKEEAGSSGQKANPNPNPNPKQGKEAKGLKMFKCALVEVVKDLLKPTWKEGQLSREVHKTIVKKVVDKVIGTMEGSSVPPTQEKIDIYISHSKPKLTKLVQGYVEKYVK